MNFISKYNSKLYQTIAQPLHHKDIKLLTRQKITRTFHKPREILPTMKRAKFSTNKATLTITNYKTNVSSSHFPLDSTLSNRPFYNQPYNNFNSNRPNLRQVQQQSYSCKGKIASKHTLKPHSTTNSIQFSSGNSSWQLHSSLNSSKQAYPLPSAQKYLQASFLPRKGDSKQPMLWSLLFATPEASRPSPFGNDEDESELKYDENNIHFDFSQQRRHYKLSATGEEIEIDPNDEVDVKAIVEKAIDDIIDKTAQETQLARQSALVMFLKSNIDKTKRMLGDDNQDNNNTEDSNSNGDSDKARNESTNQSKTTTSDNNNNNTFQTPLPPPPSTLLERFKSYCSDILDIWFPRDLIDVLDITFTQIEHVFDMTIIGVKSYLWGGLAALLLRTSLLEYTKTYFYYGSYVYIGSYILFTSYLMANLVHIAAVTMAEYPLLEHFIKLGMELQKLSTAPPYMVARVIFRFANHFLTAQQALAAQKQHALDQRKKENTTMIGDENTNTNNTKTVMSYNSDGEVEMIEYNNNNNEIIRIRSPNYDSIFMEKDSSIFDSLMSSINDGIEVFKSPGDVLTALHEQLEELNKDTEDLLSHAQHKNSHSLYHLGDDIYSRILRTEKVNPEDQNKIDILVDEHVKITQDVKTDTTILEVSSPTTILGSNFTIVTPNSNITIHA